MKVCVVSASKSTVTGTSSAPPLDPVRARARRRRSRSATVSPRPVVDEHEAAGAEAGQRALDREGGEHRGDRGVDGVAALAQHPGAGLGGQRVAGGDDAAAHARQPVVLAGEELGDVDAELAGRVLERGRAAAGVSLVRRIVGSAARARSARGAAVEAGGDRRSPRPARRASSSTLAPKMMLASGWAASPTTLAASLTSTSERSGPPVIESRIERAPSIEVSSSGEEIAFSAASIARSLAGAHADAEQRLAGVGHGRAHVGEVEVDQRRQRDQVGDALDALAQDVVGDLEGLDHRGAAASSTSSRRSLGTTISVSTSSASASMPFSAWLPRRRALEAERLGDDADGQRADVAGEPGDHRGGAGAGAAAGAGGDEDHVGALEQPLDLVLLLEGGAVADLGVGAGAEAAGLLVADVDGDVGDAELQRLKIGVDGHELDAGDPRPRPSG